MVSSSEFRKVYKIVFEDVFAGFKSLWRTLMDHAVYYYYKEILNDVSLYLQRSTIEGVVRQDSQAISKMIASHKLR